jgi:uncharacterized protein (TIGR02145 family)
MKKLFSIFVFVTCFVIAKSQQTQTAPPPFKTVTIGTQIWSAEDYAPTTFRNGDKIPVAESEEEWVNAGREKKPATCKYCIYPFSGDPVCKTLYNFYVISDPRGFTPVGWNVATDENWKELEIYLGMSKVSADSSGIRGTTEALQLKNTSDWISADVMKNCAGNNSSGFAAKPTGARLGTGKMIQFYEEALWWTSSYYDDNAVFRSVKCSNKIERQGSSKTSGMAVRLVKIK